MSKAQLAKEQFIRDSKTKPCMDCGNSFPFYVMHFDHVRGTKKFELSKARMRSLEAIEEEMAKCDVVCANCHAVRTWLRNRQRMIASGKYGMRW